MMRKVIMQYKIGSVKMDEQLIIAAGLAIFAGAVFLHAFMIA